MTPKSLLNFFLFNLIFNIHMVLLIRATAITYNVSTYVNPPNTFANGSGIAIDTLNVIGKMLNFNTNYLFFESIEECIQCIENETCQFMINLQSHTDTINSADVYKFSETITQIPYQKETYYIFFPNLLTMLILNVLQELFFIIVIILVPWILINGQIYYMLEGQKFNDDPYVKGFIMALKGLVFRGSRRLSSYTKCFLFIFYTLTVIIFMLLMGDFIYVISNMLFRYNIETVYDAMNNNSVVCTTKDDNLIMSLFNSSDGIHYAAKDTATDCFDMLDGFNLNTYFASEILIRNEFKLNPRINNKYRFENKNNYLTIHYLLVSNNVTNIPNQIIALKDEINNITKFFRDQYLAQVSFNQIIPHSIISQSILLILTSLTITSIFLIFLTCILVKNQIIKPPKNTRKNPFGKTSYRNLNLPKRPIKNRLPLERDEIQVILGPINRTPQNSNRNENFENDLTNRRKLSNDQPDNKNSATKNPKNKTLSFSGPIVIKKFDGKPDKSWLKIDQASSKDEGSFKFQGTSDFENQVSSIHKAEESAEKSQPNLIFAENMPQIDLQLHQLSSLRHAKSLSQVGKSLQKTEREFAENAENAKEE